LLQDVLRRDSVIPPRSESGAAAASGDPGLDYTRRLYANVLGWYESADRKAQLILTADGGFVTVLTALTLAKPAEVEHTLRAFGPETWLFFGVAAAAVVVAFASAALALWSRLLKQSEAESIFRRHGVRRGDATTYDPSVLWFFQLVQHLDEDALERRLHTLTPQEEIDALVDQIVALSRNVANKHRWVNVGFTATATALACLLVTSVSYAIRVGA
jgi:hypothetical protein